MNELTKQCSKCKEVKPINEYTFQDKELKLRHSQCSICKYWPKPEDGSYLRKCSDCKIRKHYKDDFPASQSCCKPCHALRKKNYKRVDYDDSWEQTGKIFTEKVCRIILDGEELGRICGTCKEMRLLSEYNLNNKKQCKICIQELKAEKMEDPYEFLKYKYERAIIRSKEKNIEFSITYDQWKYIFFVKQRCLCALSGLYMTHKMSNKWGPRSPSEFPLNLSPDRKDSTKGYTFENVQFVRWCLNSAKNDMEQEAFIQMCTEVAEYHKKVKEPHWTPEA